MSEMDCGTDLNELRLESNYLAIEKQTCMLLLSYEVKFRFCCKVLEVYLRGCGRFRVVVSGKDRRYTLPLGI
jgi:hypothetical protein